VRIRNDDRSGLTCIQAERTARLEEASVGLLLNGCTEPPLDRVRNRTCLVARGATHITLQVTEQLLDATRIRERRAVGRVREHREADLVAGRRVDRAAQVLHTHEAGALEERRSIEVRTSCVVEVVRHEFGVIRDAHVQRQNRR
jgi:hypothetical protein